MKYLYYNNIDLIPLYIKQQISENLYSVEDLLNDLIRGIESENYLFMFLVDGKKLVGLLGIAYLSSTIKKKMKLKFTEKTYHLGNVFIMPNYRGKGFCKKMVEEIKSHVIKKGIARRLKLDVEENNIPAIKCYTSTGFHLYKNRLAQKWLNDNWEKNYGFKPSGKMLIYTVKL